MFGSIYPQTPLAANDSTKKTIKFPQDLQVILRSDRPSYGNLYISNVEAAENQQLLEHLQIKAIVTAAKGHAPKHPKERVQHTKYLPLDDDQKDQIYPYLDECVDFIVEQLKQTNVLVHCIAGVSRSAAITIAYLIRERKLTLQDAFNQVKSRRKIIHPSPKIMQQLKRFEQDVLSKRSKSKLNTSMRVETNPDKSNIANRASKTQLFDQRSQYNEIKMGKLNTSYLKIDDIDQIKSQRTNKSCSVKNDHHSINISVWGPSKKQSNPEQSFISRTSSKGKSALNKSFATSKIPTVIRDSICTQSDAGSQLQELRMTKKSSSSRDDFTRKISLIDERNTQINSKIAHIHYKFQQIQKSHKIHFQNQLQQINQVKTMLKTQMSDRKSKLLDKSKILHDNTMDDKQVRNYIMSTLYA